MHKHAPMIPNLNRVISHYSLKKLQLSVHYDKIPAMTQVLIFVYSGESTFLSELYLERQLKSHSDFIPAFLESVKDPQHIIDHINQPQLFRAQEFIVCKSADFLNQIIPDKTLNAFMTCCETLDSSIKLALIYPGNLDKRKKITKWINESPHIQHRISAPFLDWESQKACQWICDEAKQLSLTISISCAQVLVDYCGLEPAILYQRIQSLKNFVGHQTVVSPEDIHSMFSADQSSIFKFMEGLKAPKIQTLAPLLYGLLESGEAPVKLIGLIASQFRFYLDILILSETMNQSDLAKTLGKHPYLIQKIQPEIQRHYPISTLKNILHKTAALDLASKNGDLDPKIALESLVQYICLSKAPTIR